MAKPSVTNIRPPKAPPVTDYVLGWGTDDEMFALNINSPAVQNSGETLPLDNSKFLGLVAKIDPNFWADWGLNAEDFDYIFLGANSKDDLKVDAGSFSELGGIIATGNGKDVIHAGKGDDLVMAGNGVDIVHGGAGHDSLFGENGSDQLFGDEGDDYLDGGNGDDVLTGGTDDGQFQASGSALVLLDGVALFQGALGENPGQGQWTGSGGNTYTDNSETLQKQGFYINQDDVFQVFNFSPKNYPDLALDDNQTFSVVLYGNGFTGPGVHLTDFTVTESKSWNFAVNLSDHSDGGMVVVFKGDYASLTQAQLDNPNQNSLKQQAFDALEDVASGGQGDFSFVAGDVLTGGEGADIFAYNKGDGVDEVTDYNRDEGDKIRLGDILQSDVDVLNFGGDSYIVFRAEGGGYLQDAAIKLTGVADFNASEIEFTA